MYRRGRIVVDAELGDWDGPTFEARFAETELPPNQANEVVARMTWDARALYLAIDVRDEDVVAAPEEIADFRLARWDCVEIYIDTDASSGARMEPSDFQIILACDGRSAVMQGSAILARFPMLVPKVEHEIAIVAAAAREPWGYRIEAMIPFAGLGMANVEAGMCLRVDVANGEWLHDHPVLPEVDWSPEALQTLAKMHDPFNAAPLTNEGVERIVAGSYRPLAWSGSRDWGFPDEWREVRLVGRAGWIERAVERRGLAWFVRWSVVPLTAALMVLLVLERRQRRRFRVLLEQLARAERLAPQRQLYDDADPAASSDEMRLDASTTLDKLVTLNCGSPESLIERAIAHVRLHLEDGVTPSELARAVNVSLRTLQRRLTAELGCTPNELILAVKMCEAQKLLLTGCHQVTEVAQRVGFSTPAYFASRFKAYFKVSPSEMARRRAS